MRHLLAFLHLLGFVLWMGGGMASLIAGGMIGSLPRAGVGVALELQGRVIRAMILPGAVLVVLSGLILTLRLYGPATSVGGFPPWMMVMQGAGLVAAALVIVVTVPTSARLARLDPAGPHAPLFDALRRRLRLSEIVAGLLAVLALLGAVMLR